ncbi:MAG TPA: hypothetical protein VIU15_39180 [Streptomyces sp.]
MDTELATLAASAANALVSALTTETWERARAFLARRRGTPGADLLALELTRDRERLLADPANTENRAALTTVWQQRFRALIADDPDAARALFVLLAELTDPGSRSTGPTFNADSRDNSTIYQAYGDINIGQAPKP